jgi:hypothetical protein
VAARPAVARPRLPPAGGACPAGGGPIRWHTQRLLTVVKSGSIQQTRAEAADKVHVWPHLLVIEFASPVCRASRSSRPRARRCSASRLAHANPSKAPWYFLGLQELLTMFHPMVAGVLLPGMVLMVLILAPYVDKNPSNKPEDRKFAISMMTIHLMMWGTLVMIGSFFRGPGQNFVFPWNDGLFFEL